MPGEQPVGHRKMQDLLAAGRTIVAENCVGRLAPSDYVKMIAKPFSAATAASFRTVRVHRSEKERKALAAKLAPLEHMPGGCQMPRLLLRPFDWSEDGYELTLEVCQPCGETAGFLRYGVDVIISSTKSGIKVDYAINIDTVYTVPYLRRQSVADTAITFLLKAVRADLSAIASAYPGEPITVDTSVESVCVTEGGNGVAGKLWSKMLQLTFAGGLAPEELNMTTSPTTNAVSFYTPDTEDENPEPYAMAAGF